MSTLTGLIGGGGGDVVQSQLGNGGPGDASNQNITIIPSLQVTVSNTWQTLLSLNTGGYLWNCLYLAGANANVGVKITIDGTLVFTGGPLTHPGNTTYYQLWPPALSGSTAQYSISDGLAAAPLRFESSLLIEGRENAGILVVYPGYSID